MTTTIDGVLVQWGDRLFYPPSRTSKATPLPRLDALVADGHALAHMETGAPLASWWFWSVIRIASSPGSPTLSCRRAENWSKTTTTVP